MKKSTRILGMLLAIALVIGILPTVVPSVAEAAVTDTPAGVRNHLPTTAKDIVYLSDMAYEYSDNHPDNNFADRGYHFVKDGAWRTGDIVLGNTAANGGTTFTKGLGVMPKNVKNADVAADRSNASYTVFDLADNGYEQSYFYSAVGITNNRTADTGVVFEVWASYDKPVEDYSKAEYVLLESSGTVKKTNVYQFHLDVTGARYLKLVVYAAANSISGMNCAWGGTCVYNNSGYYPKTDMISARTSDGGEYVAFADRDETFKTQTPTMFNEFECMFNTYNYMNLPSDAEYLAQMSNDTSKSAIYNGGTTPSSGTGWLGGTHVAVENYAGTLQTNDYQKDGIKFNVDTNGNKTVDTNEKNSIYFNVRTPAESDNVTDGYVVYNLGGAYDTFYSIIGATNTTYKYTEYAASSGSCGGMVFEVWGTYEGSDEFVLLSASEAIMLSNTGEFFVDVTGVQLLKLRIRAQDPRTHSYASGGFVYASVYTRDSGEVSYTNMALENNLPMSFAVKQDTIADWTGHYAEITYGDSKEKVDFSAWGTDTINGEDYYTFTYGNVAAKEMTDKVSVTIYDRYGLPVSEVYEDTVQAYCLRKLATTTDESLQRVIVDLLNYGTAAQNHFGHNTGTLANDTAALEEYKALGGKAPEAYVNNRVVTGEGYFGTDVVLDSNIRMRFAFTGLNDTMSAVVTYTDHYGVEQTVNIAGSDFVVDGNYHIVVLDKLVVADCRKDVTVTIMDGETEVVKVVDSVASYLARKVENGETSAVFDALMTLCDSALAFFHPAEN